MKVKWFRSIRFHNDFELNFIGKIWNFRIGRSQITLWRNYEPMFSWFRKVSLKGAWHDPIM